MTDLTRAELDGQRAAFELLPEDWQPAEFAVELDRVAGVIDRRDVLVDALAEAAGFAAAAAVAASFDVDVAVDARARVIALEAVLLDQPPAEIGWASLVPVGVDVRNRLPGAIPPEQVPALDYRNEIEIFRATNSTDDPPVRTPEDAAAQVAIDAARVRFAGWASTIRLLLNQSSSTTNLIGWLSTAADVLATAAAEAMPLYAELTATIVAANRIRREQGLTWRPPRPVDLWGVGSAFTDVLTPVQIPPAQLRSA